MKPTPLSRRSALFGMLAGLFGWVFVGKAAASQQPAASPDPAAETKILSHAVVVDDVASVITLCEYDAEGSLLSTTQKDPQPPR